MNNESVILSLKHPSGERLRNRAYTDGVELAPAGSYKKMSYSAAEH